MSERTVVVEGVTLTKTQIEKAWQELQKPVLTTVRGTKYCREGDVGIFVRPSEGVVHCLKFGWTEDADQIIVICVAGDRTHDRGSAYSIPKSELTAL
jgi:hypothetical protein